LNTQPPKSKQPHQTNKPSHSFKIFKHSDHNQALVFCGLYPTTTSSFLEIDGLMCPIIVVRLSPLFLKELWVKTSMHRTPGTILATSRNKVKHLSPLHYFTQAREYNTQTNPLSLLHIGERVITGSLSTKNLIQHLTPTRVFKQGKTLPICNTWRLHIVNQIHTLHHAWKIKFHNINPWIYQIIHSYNELNEWHSLNTNITSHASNYPQTTT